MIAASDLLSVALRTGGEWINATRAASDGSIRNDYLVPAAEYAVSADARIKAYTTLGKFIHRLHQTNKNRVNSAEWQQRKRAAEAREREKNRLREEMAVAKGERERPTEMTEREKALMRYLNTVAKDIASERNERETVEAQVQTSLLDALAQFAKVLQVSG